MIFKKIGVGALAMTAALGIGYFAVSAGPTLAQAKSQDKKTELTNCNETKLYTQSFRSAKPAEVATWIQKEGINLKVREADLPLMELTMAFEGLDSDDVVRKFGKAVGLTPVSRDGVYALMRGVGGDSTSEPLGLEDSQDKWLGGSSGISPWKRLNEFGQDRDDEEFEIEFDNDFDYEGMDFEFGQDFNFVMPDVSKIISEVMAALKDAGIQDGDRKLSKGQEEKLRESLKRRLGNMHEKMGNMNFNFQERFNGEHMAEMEKHMAEMEKHFNSDEFKKMMKEHGGKGFVFNSGAEGMELRELMELRGLEEGQLKGLEELRFLQDGKLKELFEMDIEKMRNSDGKELTDKEKQEVKKAMAEAKIAMEEAMKGFKEGDFKIHLKDGMKAREEAMRSMKEHMGDERVFMKEFNSIKFEKMMEKQFGERGELKKELEKMNGKLKIEMKDLEKKMANLKTFMNSLTDDQKALAKKQGHLKWTDLTKKQQELLGEFGKEGGTIRFNMDDRDVTIKKDKKKSGISA